jgi:Uma2 family endonuclease
MYWVPSAGEVSAFSSYPLRMLTGMKTVVLGDMPEVLASLIAERQRLGLDTHDEVWNGEYHMAPAASFRHSETVGLLFELLRASAVPKGLRTSVEFNLGRPSDFRVPDLGVHRGNPEGVWLNTAAMVVEVRSPNDETYDKFGFYFEHGVEEVLVADLATSRVTVFVRAEHEYIAAEVSVLLGLTVQDVAVALAWSA